MDAFVLSFKKNPKRRRLVEKLMAVSISRFFRDRKLWETMERHVLPAMIAEGKQETKVWSAGCASGEEIYSFRILWEEWARNRDRTPKLELWATDMNPELIDRARTGVYSSSSLKEVPEEWRSKYFSPVKANRWAISDLLKEGIHWKVHNLLVHEPPSIGFQIIFLRNNLLTYYKVETLRPALAKLIETLSPSGFLMIGVHENLPREFTELAPFPHHPNIFQKIPFSPSPLWRLCRNEGKGPSFRRKPESRNFEKE